MIQTKLFRHSGSDENENELSRLLNDGWAISHFAGASRQAVGGHATMLPIALILLIRNVDNPET